MKSKVQSPELESRLEYLKFPENQGKGFSKVDWIWLVGLGVIGPVVLLIWGWM